ncbi:MAG: protein kinase [Bdellovibrionota bacterium]
MNTENYIKSQYYELKLRELLNPEFLTLYKDIENETLKEIFASIHKHYITLFKRMNDRLPTGDYTANFWAAPSRDLIWIIDMTMGLYRSLQGSKDAFAIDDYYLKLLNQCQSFLNSSNGSILPAKMEKVILYYIEPIFKPLSLQKIIKKSSEHHYPLKLIGEGSYALIFKFRDEHYNRDYAIKRAKKDLSKKELERFKREFEEMQRLSSPYILEVFTFDEAQSQYTMEYMNYSLDAYIQQFNNKITQELRRNISFQILKAFSYLHSKNLIHRDISPKNILLKEYEDVVVVKVSDFGLVKTPESNLTSVNTELKGYFNDPVLATEGFDNYDVLHEIYALTKLLFYVMTGKTNTASISDHKWKIFVEKGLNPDKAKRYRDINEITEAFRVCTLS